MRRQLLDYAVPALIALAGAAFLIWSGIAWARLDGGNPGASNGVVLLAATVWGLVQLSLGASALLCVWAGRSQTAAQLSTVGLVLLWPGLATALYNLPADVAAWIASTTIIGLMLARVARRQRSHPVAHDVEASTA